jgi:hypothetical protein
VRHVILLQLRDEILFCGDSPVDIGLEQLLRGADLQIARGLQFLAVERSSVLAFFGLAMFAPIKVAPLYAWNNRKPLQYLGLTRAGCLSLK